MGPTLVSYLRGVGVAEASEARSSTAATAGVAWPAEGGGEDGLTRGL